LSGCITIAATNVFFARSSTAVLLIVAAVCLYSPAPLAGEERKDEVLAAVNNEWITVADYKRFLMKVDPGLDSSTVSRKLLEKLIEERLMLQEARQKGIAVTDAEVEQSIRDLIADRKLAGGEFEKTVTGQGMTVAEYKKWLKDNIIVLSKIIYSEIDSKVSVTENEIASYYEQNRDLFIRSPERMTVGAIIMRRSDNPSPEEITELRIKSIRIVADLRKGEPFEKLASLYSDDPSAANNGVLGIFGRGELVPAVDNALSSLKEGEISDPVWVREGIFIVKLIGRTKVTYVSLDDARKPIRTTLLNEKKENAYIRWINSLRAKATILIK